MHSKVALFAMSLIGLWGGFAFSGFVADDAYIVFRYAENLVDHEALVFNPNERVSALTSPLHALVAALLYGLTRNTVLAYQIVGIAALLGTGLIFWRLLRTQHDLRLLAISLVCLPPAVMLWTFGGLETPLLMLSVAAAAGLLFREEVNGPLTTKNLIVLVVIAGTGFLLRFDSVLFFAPLVLAGLLRAPSRWTAAGALAAGALLPALWLLFAYQYYGDVLPTSFYEKTPRFTLPVLLVNFLYTLSFLIFSGIAVVMLLPFAAHASPGTAAQAWVRALQTHWYLWLGLTLVLGYGLTMATSHMMFSYRYFVPYIPAAALAVIGALPTTAQPPGRLYAIRAALWILLGMHAYQYSVTASHSLNGLAPIGEFRNWGVREYNKGMQEYELLAREIKAHWETHGKADRPPRINTFAAGLLPYVYRDAYIYGLLISYRHCAASQQLSFDECGTWVYENTKPSADYIVVLYPLYGELEDQLPLPPDSYTTVADREVLFDGYRQQVRVVFNTNPEPHTLGNTVNVVARHTERGGMQPTPFK